jgi:hypothetical protein
MLKAVFILLFYMAILPVNSAYSCSCGYFTPYDAIESRIESSRFILSGKVISSGFVESGDAIYVRHKVRVIQAYKGNFSSKVIYIYSNNRGSNCGVKFAKGTKVLFYFYDKQNMFFTDACSPNKLLDRAEKDLEILKKKRMEN